MHLVNAINCNELYMASPHSAMLYKVYRRADFLFNFVRRIYYVITENVGIR